MYPKDITAQSQGPCKIKGKGSKMSRFGSGQKFLANVLLDQFLLSWSANAPPSPLYQCAVRVPHPH